jgi:hypothetical protein
MGVMWGWNGVTVLPLHLWQGCSDYCGPELLLGFLQMRGGVKTTATGILVTKKADVTPDERAKEIEAKVRQNLFNRMSGLCIPGLAASQSC